MRSRASAASGPVHGPEQVEPVEEYMSRCPAHHVEGLEDEVSKSKERKSVTEAEDPSSSVKSWEEKDEEETELGDLETEVVDRSVVEEERMTPEP